MRIILTLGIVSIACCNLYADSSRQTEDLGVQFEREVRPVLVGKCIQCHGATKQEGGLRLDSLEAILEGGDSGPALVPGKPEESILIDALNHNGFEMPPTGKLPDDTIAQIEKWVHAGAFWPETSQELRSTDSTISDADRSWWAFQPLARPEVPADPDDTWSKSEIDRFVWKSFRDHQLAPSPQADKTTLIRRLYFDLIGIPPTPAEIDAFVADESPDAFDATVEKLLQDPRYGEHWARFWLDLVRYSESDGWNLDSHRPLIWQYRDYVINAFNKDMSYQQFVLDQLAGDESIEEHPDGLIAAGFMRLGVYEYNQRNARGQWNDIMNEMTDVAGDVFFGMSVSCARCHQHKFDPIPQADYFQLRSFFEPVCWRDDLVANTEAEQKEFQEKQAIWEKETAPIRAKIAKILEPYEKARWAHCVSLFPIEIQACFNMPRDERTSWQEQMAYLISRQYMEEGGGPYKKMTKEDIEKRDALLKELAEFDSIKPAPLRKVMTVTDFDGLLSPTRIPDSPSLPPIKPGFLDVLNEIPELPSLVQGDAKPGSTGNRTALAKWITHPKNPLTTRVIVNRIWQQHFGEGIVRTSNDFGRLGDSPSHPELLDWLTMEFIENGWTFKHLHRMMVRSAVWQQSAVHPEGNRQLAADPDEKLLWRARVRRLKAEQIRDAMLVASNELSATVGGASVGEDKPRRSIYLTSFRNKNDTFLHGFDVANGLQSVAVRDNTTTPTQSLLLLNGKYARGRADAFGKRLLEQYSDPTTAIIMAFRSTWGVPPSETELHEAQEFVKLGAGEDSQGMDTTKFLDFCHILFNSNQFLYLE